MCVHPAGSGTIGFDELYEFVRGGRHALDRRSQRVHHLVLRPPTGAGWSLTDVEWDEEVLRAQLKQMLDRAG